MKRLITAGFLGLLCSSASHAGETYLQLEPLLGWEQTQADFAGPRTVYRLIYGARAVAGYKRVALEGAYFRGSLEDRVPSQDYAASESTEALQGGLRYTHPVFSFFAATAQISAVFEDPEHLFRRISPQLSFGIVLSPF